jgi:hypothetical protein
MGDAVAIAIVGVAVWGVARVAVGRGERTVGCGCGVSALHPTRSAAQKARKRKQATFFLMMVI